MINSNIDGLPLFHSASQQLWPILALISNDAIKNASPFAVGIFCGKTKPSSLESYLEDFINDLLELTSKGFTLNLQHFSVVIHKCFEMGEYHEGRAILCGTNATKHR